MAGFVFLVTTVTRTTSAGADDARLADAAQAYDAGLALARQRDFAHAAVFFARADELAPSDVALDAALKAALAGDVAPLGMELVERSGRTPTHGVLSARVAEARQKFARRVGVIELTCGAATPCELEIDGRRSKSHTWIDAGVHSAVLRAGATPPETRSVTVFPAGVVTLRPSSPEVSPPAAPTPSPSPAFALESTAPSTPSMPAAAAEPAHPSSTSGLSPAWFWSALALTGVAGAAAVGSGVDYVHKRDAFDAAPSDARASSGRAAELRTNVLLLATLGLGVATGVLGLFAVEWRASPRGDRATSATFGARW